MTSVSLSTVSLPSIVMATFPAYERISCGNGTWYTRGSSSTRIEEVRTVSHICVSWFLASNHMMIFPRPSQVSSNVRVRLMLFCDPCAPIATPSSKICDFSMEIG